MNITPDQADKWAQGATDGPWILDPYGCIIVDDGTDDPPGPHGVIGSMYRRDPDDTANGELMAAAPDLAQTIAGMEWQWSVEKHDGHRWSRHGGWVGPESIARLRLRKSQEDGETARLVRRLVGPVEVTE